MVTRIIVGGLLIAFFAVLLWFGGLFQSIIIAIATLISVWEMKRAFAAKGTHVFALPAYVFAAGYVFMFEYFQVTGLVTLMLGCVIVTLLESLFNSKRTDIESYYALSLYCYPILFYIMLMVVGSIHSYEVSRVALLLLFAAPLVGDMFAYFIGVAIGKHKLCPSISPKKTVEGSIGGLFGSLVGGLLVYFLQRIWGLAIPYWHLLLISIGCGVLGQLGDLYASKIKRWAGVKDYGTLFPGHGGVMDRADSALMCAPLVLIYFYLMFVA